MTPSANPNGSLHNIAGICNEARNVVGLMPHPERACEPALGSADGLVLFESVVQAAHGPRTLDGARHRSDGSATEPMSIDPDSSSGTA